MALFVVDDTVLILNNYNLYHSDGSGVNDEDKNGLTPIQWAAFYGQMSSIKILLSHGADLHHRGASGENALMLASANGHAHVVRALLKMGADMKATDEVSCL